MGGGVGRGMRGRSERVASVMTSESESLESEVGSGCLRLRSLGGGASGLASASASKSARFLVEVGLAGLGCGSAG